MKKYFTTFKTNLIKIFAERETVFIWSIASALDMSAIVALWLAGNTEKIGNFTRSELISYYLIIFFLEQFIGWWCFWTINPAIRDGTISNYLLKPISYFKVVFSQEFAYKLINLFTHFVIGSILVFFLRNHITFSLSFPIIVKIIPAILIAIGINYFTHFAMGCATFFWTESQFLADFHWMGSTLLGGKIIPLAFFPAMILPFFKWNPFRFTFSLPAEILLGQLNGAEYIKALSVGLIWLIFIITIAAILWKKGLKHYGAYGS